MASDLKPDPILQAWQALLVKAGYPMLPDGADGFGGKITRAALIAFQKKHGLIETGQFDAATRAALNPPPTLVSIPAPIVEFAVETALDAIIPPSPAKVALMSFLPTIVQWIVALVPGIPDDINAVRAEFTELVSTDSGVAKVRSFIAFARVMLNVAEEVVNKADPGGAVAPSTPIPPAVAATK